MTSPEFGRCRGHAVFGREGSVYIGRYEWKEALDDCVDRWDETYIEVKATPAEAMQFAKAVLERTWAEVPENGRPTVTIWQDEYGPCITWRDKDVCIHDEEVSIGLGLAEDIVRTVANMGGHQ